MVTITVNPTKPKSFVCPHCDVLAAHIWSSIIVVNYDHLKPSGQTVIQSYELPSNIATTRCSNCNEHAFWKNSKMIYPLSSFAEMPNADMPEEVKKDYLEARDILPISPRGAAALLRLAVQKLMIHLGEKGNNINDDIKSLVKKGLPVSLQQALDSVRVVGNNAVHPGQIIIEDNPETAIKLFGFVNIIVDLLITQPKKINEYYTMILTDDARESIARRDGKGS